MLKITDGRFAAHQSRFTRPVPLDNKPSENGSDYLIDNTVLVWQPDNVEQLRPLLFTITSLLLL